MRLFSNIIQGTFTRRINRFAIECLLDGEVIQAHLPNPGRLWELLIPGRMVSLVKSEPAQERSTLYTAVAVYREGIPVLLHTHMANTVVKYLLDKNKIHGLENAQIIKQEAAFGGSRFDFLLQKGKNQFVLEVKSCTLFGKHIAMFPDAVTQRGRKHLIELAELTKKGIRSGVVFVVHWPRARFFLPDYHTDFDFAQTFLSLKDNLMYKAVSVEWENDLSLGENVCELDIPWEILRRESHDSGSYILILHFHQDAVISVGGLGNVSFPHGHYLYVGSARTNLKKRMERHLRRRKNFFWHIDYLRDHAGACTAIPVRSQTKLEHELASAIGRIADWSIPRFGASDCSCDTHLFAMNENPVHSPKFIEVLQHFRIDRLDMELY